MEQHKTFSAAYTDSVGAPVSHAVCIAIGRHHAIAVQCMKREVSRDFIFTSFPSKLGHDILTILYYKGGCLTRSEKLG